MKVEFLKAYDDGTWDTEVIDIPDETTSDIKITSSEWDSVVIAWCHNVLASLDIYRNVVYWGIYNSEPDYEGN